MKSNFTCCVDHDVLARFKAHCKKIEKSQGSLVEEFIVKFMAEEKDKE